MAGFRNEVLHAVNVDFSGGSPVVGKVVADGQLLIGATAAPNIRVATLTAGAGISITNGAGSIQIDATGLSATTFTADAGSATPAGNNINIIGTSGQGITSSGAGSTITFTVANATTVSKGVASFDAGDFTVTAGAVSINGTAFGQTITGDTGGALAPTASNWNIVGTSAQGITSSGSGSTLTFTNADWTTLQKGVGVLATNAEAIAGTSTTKAVTPDDLKAKLGTQTQYASPYGNATTGAIQWTNALTDGQLMIGATGAAPVASTLTAGANVTITNAANSITIAAASGGLSWNEVVGVSQAMAVGNGYVANNAGLVTLTLPATAAFGDIIRVAGKGAGLFAIAQNASQTIKIASSATTVGVGGSLTAVGQYNALEILCITANTTFEVISSVGNFTVV